jgi:hypothetical protein
MNLAMLDGLVAETAHDALVPRLEPREGWCCVRIAAATSEGTTSGA